MGVVFVTKIIDFKMKRSSPDKSKETSSTTQPSEQKRIKTNDTPLDVGLVLNTVNFAAIKHRDQRRKNAIQAPYINHPIGVAYCLWNEGGVQDIEVIQAALLHDTVEDTNTTHEELVTEFGE